MAPWRHIVAAFLELTGLPLELIFTSNYSVLGDGVPTHDPVLKSSVLLKGWANPLP